MRRMSSARPFSHIAATVAALGAALLGLAPAHAAAAAAADYAGRPLAQVLRGLSGPHLQFIFSSRLLPDSLRVPASLELAAEQLNDPLRTATALLARERLALTPVAPGLYAVVAQRGATAPETAAAPTAPEPPTALSEVVVAASRYRVADPASLARIATVDLALESVVGSDPLRGLGRLPGVLQDGLSARPHVRGSEDGETLLLLDGYPLRSTWHLSTYQSPFSVLDAGVLASTDVYTGGFPVRYGGRMGAVFDMRTRDAAEEPRHSVGVDFVNASARAAGELPGGGAFLGSARIGTLQPLLHALAPGVGDPRYGDAYLRVTAGPAEGLRVSGNLLWSRDDLAISEARRGESAEIQERMRYVWLRADAPLWNAAHGTLWLGQSLLQTYRDGTLANPGIASGSVSDHRSSTLWDARAAVTWEIGPNHHLEGGAETTQENGHYDYSADARFTPDVALLFGRPAAFSRELQLEPGRRRTSLYAAHRWRILRQLTTEFGLRAEGVVTEGLESNWGVDPRFGLRWESDTGTRLHATLGRYRQTDEIQELKIEDGLSAFPAPQRSLQFIVGLEQPLRDDVALRVEAFSKQQTDPRARFENVLNRRTILPEIAPDRVELLPDYAELQGIEVTLEGRRGPWRLVLGAGWSQAVDESDGVHTLRSWDVGWDVQTTLAWAAGPWSASAALRVHPGLPTTELLQTATGNVLGRRNGTRLPRYADLDAGVRYTRQLPSGALETSVQVGNALARRNDCCSDLLQGDEGLYLRRLRGLPLLPSVGLRWSW